MPVFIISMYGVTLAIVDMYLPNFLQNVDQILHLKSFQYHSYLFYTQLH